ncbi:hypothetical protein TDB9533_03693 [Thalassocella blandensis]|nr:hypothetical protein TDB9533_03693 [Thalassocella blandensis]
MRVECPECGHTFVSKLSLKHSLSPSCRSTQLLVFEYFKSVPQTELNSLLVKLSKYR